jgi:2-polyprenyl-3-methyl-5-hydroxy-6-metoxy-1,4-benzoquinol methylase
MIELANKKVAELDISNAVYVQGSVFDERYISGTYDLILALNILLYFKDTEKVIERIYQLLKPGGIVISSTACLADKKTLLSAIAGTLIYLFMKMGILPEIRYLKMTELENMMKKEGFKIAETDVLTLNPATEYLIIARKTG